VGDLLFVASCAGACYGFDLDSGAIAWKYPTDDDSVFGFHGNPCLFENLIIIGADAHWRGRRGFIYAFDAATGAVQWKFRADPGVPSDIVRLDSSVFAVTLGDELICLNAATGDLRWRFQGPWSFNTSDQTLLTSSPLLVDSLVYFLGRDSVIYALHAGDGRLVWKTETKRKYTTALCRVGNTIAAGTAGGDWCQFDPASGATTAIDHLPFVPKGIPLYVDDLLLMAAKDSSGRIVVLASWDVAAHQVHWQYNVADSADTFQWNEDHLLRWHDMVVAGTYGGNVVAFRLVDGAPVWKYHIGGIIVAIGCSSETLFVGTRGGMIYAFKP
jgi:outer membrane protein assembly factor BamB